MTRFLSHSVPALRRRLGPHRDFLFLLALFTSFRVFALAFFSPGDRIEPLSDFGHYLELARWSDLDLYPYLDYWSEYPPLFPWLSVALYRLIRTVPIWGPVSQVLWFHLAVGSLLLVADVLILGLIYALALRLYGRRSAERRAILYAFLFMPAYAMMAWFDPLPTSLLLLGSWLVLRRSWAGAGAAAAVGGLLKVFPLLVLPVAARAAWDLPRRRRALLALAAPAALVLLVGLAPLVRQSPEVTVASLLGPLSRSSWETPGALLEGYFGVGSAGGDRFVAAEAGRPVHPTSFPWPALILAVAGLSLLALLPRPGPEPRSLLALTGLLLHLLVLGSKGWSPQFLVWLLPLIVLLLEPPRALAYALALTALNLLEGPIYMFMVPHATWLLGFTVTGRTVLLAVIGLEYAGIAFGRTLWVRSLRLAPYVAAAGLAVSLLALTPSLAAAYASRQLQQSPYAPEVALLRAAVLPREAILITDEQAYARMLPFLAATARTHPADWPQGAPGFQAYVERRTAGLSGVWTCGQEPALDSVLSASFTRVARFRVNACPLSHWVRQPERYAMLEEAVSVEGVGRLRGYRWRRAAQGLELRLLWQAGGPAELDYSVFVHLLGQGDRPLAQADGGPCLNLCRTGAWEPGAVIEDVRLLGGDAPGAWRVAVGMYRWDTLERLPLSQGGRPLEGDRFLIPVPEP